MAFYVVIYKPNLKKVGMLCKSDGIDPSHGNKIWIHETCILFHSDFYLPVHNFLRR